VRDLSSAPTALKRRLLQQEALVQLSQLALEVGDPVKVMEVAASRVAEIQGAEIVSINELVGGDHMVARVIWGPLPDLVGVVVPLHERTPAGLAVGSGQPVVVIDLNRDPRFDAEAYPRRLQLVSGVNVLIPSPGGVFGVVGLWTRRRSSFHADDLGFVQAVANLIGGAVGRAEIEARLARLVQEQERRLRHELGISQCARALLGDYHPAAVQTSLRALMEMTGAAWGQIDWRHAVEHSDGIVRLRDGIRDQALDGYWNAMTWQQPPSLHDRLAQGITVTVRTPDLAPGERAVMEAAPLAIGSMVAVPIMVEGAWCGTMQLGVAEEHHRWDQDQVAGLEMAASLLASWRQRRDYETRLESALSSRSRSLRLEKAVASASQVLTRASRPEDVEGALAALLKGTDASSVFLERNVEDPVKGLCSQVEAVVRREGAGYDPRYWDMMPWDRMPTSRAALSAGEVMVVATANLQGEEALTYAASPVKSEIDVPIMIDGKWVGLIGLADERVERDWDDELEMLRTAADLIASFWRRLQASERLEELMRSKDEFIASISHELRTPLTAVVGLAEALAEPARKLTEEEASEFVQIIAEQSAEMAAIVQDLLVVARSEIGPVAIRPVDVNLRSEVEASMRGLRPERRSDLEITGQAKAKADPIRVRQIVRNLLSNAGRYGGPRIRVELAERDGRAVLTVMDDGPGIPAEDRERIFRPYERAHHRHGQPASVGLGLTVSRQLAELMEGSLSYWYRDGWSGFTLELPGGPIL
jgi:GAF domain-containing protein